MSSTPLARAPAENTRSPKSLSLVEKHTLAGCRERENHTTTSL